MKQTITCPKCNNQFEISEVLEETFNKQLEVQMHQWKSNEELQYKNELDKLKKSIQSNEEETNKKILAEREKTTAELEEVLKQKVQDEFQMKLRALEENNSEKEKQLKQAREKELEFLKKSQELKDKEENYELAFQRKLLEEGEKIKNNAIQFENEKQKLKEEEYKFKIAELQEKYSQQLKLAEEMSKKGSQGSMQLQGEVQELLLENLLKETFPDDSVEPIAKGVSGADIVLNIINKNNENCGSIVFESKKTKTFDKAWIEKLNKDKIASHCEIAVLVSQTLPKEYDGFYEKEGVWITSFSEVKALVFILRELLIKVHQVTNKNKNISDKMSILYQYFISNEFNDSWNLIKKGFSELKTSITAERSAMEKSWKAREKHLDSILLNVSHIKGSIEGISGQTQLDFGFYLEN